MKYFIAGIVAIAAIGLFSLTNGSQKLLEKLTDLTEVEPKLSWQEDDNSLSLLNGGEVVWRLNYDKSEDKPYFYPLRTLDGIELALQRPEDHPWHRGLWFSWKTINELNYWEEDPQTGLALGRTMIRNVDTQLNNDYSATVMFDLAYAPRGKDPLMLERRALAISAPDKQGNYRIDWTLQFSAQDKDLFLDREVPLKHGGVRWGGYAGLGFRANDVELDSIRYIDSNGWSRSQSLTGYRKEANWMDLSGIAQHASDKAAGLTIFDHPSNPRHPSPWYIWYQKGEHAFFMPAFLYDAPYKLSAGKSFTLQYRVLIHGGMGTVDALNAEYQAYIQ